MKKRIQLLALKGERWIQRYTRNFEPNKVDLLKSQPQIYVLFNTITKRCYVGQTQKNLKNRFQAHYSSSKIDKLRPAYRYLNKIGFENLIIYPLEIVEKENIDKKEATWLHNLRNLVVNDPIMWTRKPAKNNQPNNLNPRNFTRFERLKEQRKEYRNKIWIVMRQKSNPKSEEWRNWAISTQVYFLIQLQKAKVHPKLAQKIKRRILPNLRKQGFQIQSNYNLKLEYCKNLNKQKMLFWLKNWIMKNVEKPFSNYLCSNLKITFGRETNLAALISNRTKTIKENQEICNCSNWELPKNENGHIHLKCEDLPKKFKKEKEILIKHKKIPTTHNQFQYVGLQFYAVESFLSKILKKNIEINCQQLKEIFNFQEKGIDKTQSKRTLQKMKNNFVFLERDKNANSWSICCKKFYLENLKKQFQDPEHYKEIGENLIEIKSKIEEKAAKLETKLFNENKSRNWQIGKAYLIPKNKDLNRWRPIVSYFHFLTKKIGKWMSRCLTVLCNEIGKFWKHLNLTKTTDSFEFFKEKFDQEKWRKRLQTKEITFVKMDQKNQFTELNKDNVLKALKYALDDLQSKTKQKQFSITRSKTEKFKDRLGFSRHRDFIVISFEELYDYAKFEVGNSFFTVGSRIFEQIRGLPMGGFLSAGLASIFSMFSENTYNRIWRHQKLPAIWTRFRDDTIGIIAGKCDETYIEKIRAEWQGIYGSGIEMSLEETSKEKMNFLDFELIKINNKIEISIRNKNLENGKWKDYKRFIPQEAKIEPQIKKGMMIGIFRKCIKYSTRTELAVISILEHMQELRKIGYPLSQMKQAIRKSGFEHELKIILKILQ